jgi:hypothetical protein
VSTPDGTNGKLLWGAGTLAPEAEARFIAGVDYCGSFFTGQADAQKALYSKPSTIGVLSAWRRRGRGLLAFGRWFE